MYTYIYIYVFINVFICCLFVLFLCFLCLFVNAWGTACMDLGLPQVLMFEHLQPKVVVESLRTNPTTPAADHAPPSGNHMNQIACSRCNLTVGWHVSTKHSLPPYGCRWWLQSAKVLTFNHWISQGHIIHSNYARPFLFDGLLPSGVLMGLTRPFESLCGTCSETTL